MPAEEKKMNWSSKRIIKVREPIRKVVVLSRDEAAAENPGEGAGHFTEQHPEEVVQMSQTEFQQEIDFAYRKGLEEGKMAGYQQAENDYRQKLENLETIINKLQGQWQDFLNDSENQFLRLNLEIARIIFNRLPDYLPDLIRDSLGKVLDVIRNETSLEVQVNPEDYREHESLQREIDRRLPNLESITFKPNPKIRRGGCVVETPNGKIDSRIETQIDTVFQALEREIKSNEHPKERPN